MVDPRYFAPADIAGQYQRGVEFGEQRRERIDARENKRRLSELLPGAAHGNREAIDQLYQVNPEIALKMDDRQREQAKHELDDLTQAVRWADNPEKWQYVQQFYGQKGVDLSPYGFADREKGMVALGKLGEYIQSAPKMDIRATEPGGGLYGIQGDQVRVLVQPNDGSRPMGAPAQGGEVTATGPGGQKLRLNPQTNQWEPIGGPTSQASGGFPH